MLLFHERPLSVFSEWLTALLVGRWLNSRYHSEEALLSVSLYSVSGQLDIPNFVLALVARVFSEAGDDSFLILVGLVEDDHPG